MTSTALVIDVFVNVTSHSEAANIPWLRRSCDPAGAVRAVRRQGKGEHARVEAARMSETSIAGPAIRRFEPTAWPYGPPEEVLSLGWSQTHLDDRKLATRFSLSPRADAGRSAPNFGIDVGFKNG
jgi:hypothetical protein